ncbi:MAG: patatin-like phospholipase family protein [Xanthomonadales bacterium]|nr:patatin-like phospholipase family protein [Xanthomonadales bacterium]
MLNLQPAQNPRTPSKHQSIGLAIAGGGPIGGIYELGALRALDEAVEGLDMGRLDVYVGVSSGAFLAAGLANGLSTADMCRMFITDEAHGHQFRPEMFLRPAFAEYFKRAAKAPRILIDWINMLATHPLETRLTDVFGLLGGMVPTGLFDNNSLERFLSEVLTSSGRSNDFRELPRKLYIVAVELDTGEPVRFGAPGYDHVAVSKAVQASSALPGFYPPVEIDGKQYVDGALRRTLHASVALDEGVDLLIGINPLVPFDAARARSNGRVIPNSLIAGGLPAVLSQALRAMLQSRMLVGIAKYTQTYVNSDLIVFEPDPDDIEMFFTNVFSFASRQSLGEHAYDNTMADLRARRVEIAATLRRHGLRLRDEVLDDRDRNLWTGLGLKPPRRTSTTTQLRRTLDDLEHVLARR